MAEVFKACRDWEKHYSDCSLCVPTMIQQNFQQRAQIFFCQVMKTPRGSTGGESHCEQEYITKGHVFVLCSKFIQKFYQAERKHEIPVITRESRRNSRKTRGSLISWLESPSAVILEPQKINSVTVSTVFP